MQKDIQELQRRYYLKEMEVNSLLEITQAINENLSEDALYKIYDFTIRANLKLRKFALYVDDSSWECKVNFGSETNFFNVPIDESVHENQSAKLRDNPPFNEFGVEIPIQHNQKTLAYAFASSQNPEEEVNSTFIQAISNLILVAIENQRLAQRQLRQEALRKEMEIAKDVQRLLFPDDLPYGMRLKIDASYLPHRTVGGDYYDYIPINRNQFLICIADVSGKGVPAALMMSNFQASLRTLLRTTPNLTQIIEILNFQILENAKGDNFITFFGGIYDHKLNTLVYVNAGHNPPFLLDKKHGMRTLDEGCTILGIFHPLPFINEGFITDLDEFTLFLYTDGLTETENEQGEEFGTERMEEILEANKETDLRTLHHLVIKELNTFKGKNEYKDDITLMSCRLEDQKES